MPLVGSIMQPFSRETIIDRRSSALRWGAVVAGAAVAVGIWLLLQLFGMGVALVALDEHDLQLGAGSVLWSLVSAAVAFGLGGFLAARLAGHHNQIVAGTHAVLAWSLAALVGIAVHSIAFRTDAHDAIAAPQPGGRTLLGNALEPVNAQLRLEAKPQISVDDLIYAARRSADPNGYDRNHFVTVLDERSALMRPEVDKATRGLDVEVVTTAAQVGEHEVAIAEIQERAGCRRIVTSLALLFGLLGAIGGALLAVREMIRRRGWDEDVRPTHTTAPYPIPRAPSDYDEPR
jgi:hypothetical protein